MELIRKSPLAQVKSLVYKIIDDNLFLLSSSVSYYSALGLAPFFLIVLYCASLVGESGEATIVRQVSEAFSPEVGNMISMVFTNAREGIDIGSISGIIGALVLLFTASVVFLQFRYALDVIYKNQTHLENRPIVSVLWERLFAMLVVLAGAALLIASFSMTAIIGEFFSDWVELARFANFAIYVILFSGLHYFTPSIRPKKRHAFKMAVLSSIFFSVGNVLVASYLKTVAADSVYGAAGTLLIFLIWSYYSSFTIFLSVEFFLFLRKIGKIR